MADNRARLVRFGREMLENDRKQTGNRRRDLDARSLQVFSSSEE
jgi:hypothetical protein